VIQSRVCAFLLPVLLTFFACSSTEGESLPGKHQQDANDNSAKSSSDREHYAAGRSLAQQKRYEDATLEFRSAISNNSNNARYYDNLGFCLKQLRRDDEAIEALNHALSLDQKDAYAYRELAICYCGKKQFEKALDLLQQSISLNPSDEVGHRWLGYTFHQLQKYHAAIGALDEALKLKANDFDAHYWRGLSLFKTNQFEEAARSLGKAVELRPNDFNANFWQGVSLVRARKFKEAIPTFEKAHEVRPDDKATRIELFGCYLATQQMEKAFRIFPRIVGVVGGALTLIYFVGFVFLLPFSVPIRTLAFPGLRFSLAWLALFFEGQIAFLLFLSLFPWLKANVLASLILAGLPIAIVSATAFTRQPWGGPFRWPLRLGTWKIVAFSLLLLFFLFAINIAFSQLYMQITHKPAPIQSTIPLIKGALQASPLTAWMAVAIFVPVVEEVLFRGLLYGALEKRWGIKGAIFGSAFLFMCVHLQLVGFLYLFCFGLILGWARWQSRSLGLPIVIHSLNNSLAVLALTLSTRM
jgi:tetratricopeptide (TPR) repeat protein